MGLPHGLKLIDKKLNKGMSALMRGMHTRRKYPLCIRRCNKECLLSKTPKQVLVFVLPTYSITKELS